MALVVKKTSAKGKGVFTDRPIDQGSLITEMKGERIHAREINARIEAGTESMDDPFQISRKMYIDLDELYRTFNHSCDPNAGIRQENKLYAIRDILVGEEITYDYSTTVPSYKSWWKMRCYCGSTLCRKYASSFNKIPAKQLQKYLKLKIVPLWLRKYQDYVERN